MSSGKRNWYRAPAEFGSIYAYAGLSGTHVSTAITATMPMRVVRFIAAYVERGLYPSCFALAEPLPRGAHKSIELQQGLVVGHGSALAAMNGDG